jgi:hypothetical protein
MYSHSMLQEWCQVLPILVKCLYLFICLLIESYLLIMMI